ncbi:hypothetical protein [uncultured Eubacterium sp.]|uniref:hypothetical protein n=1 Tax=uncultured Eubacterium sp. TaxID=165185 RepID=UPI0025EAFBBD|nr:hypothetical protein [uncultured Eubacterium sp.]
MTFRAFICVAVNYDAKARGVKEKTLYTVLSFFFPLIVGIVYLCTRKNCKKIQPKICNNCHTTVDTNSTFCPNCLGTDFTDYLIRDNEKYHKNAKIFLIAGIAVYVVTCVVNVFFNIYFDKNAEPFINDIERYSNYLDNYDDKDDYDNRDYSNHFDADGYFDDFGFPKDGEEETQPDDVLPNSLQ